jgi:hypothetical protein
LIVNERGNVLQIDGAREEVNTKIVVDKKDNGLNQQWEIWYEDEIPPEPKKGDLNKAFNLHIERPFFIVSQLPDNRYLDRIGDNLVIKTPNGFKTQEW